MSERSGLYLNKRESCRGGGVGLPTEDVSGGRGIFYDEGKKRLFAQEEGRGMVLSRKLNLGGKARVPRQFFRWRGRGGGGGFRTARPS